MQRRSRTWGFVWNNYTDADLTRIGEILSDSSLVAYGCYGLETAPTTGTAHVQGYVRFVNKKSLKQLTTMLPGVHFDAFNGGDEKNRLYCAKKRPQDPVPNEVFEEFGVPMRPGKRKDWDAIRDLVKDGATDKEIFLQFPGHWIRNNQGIKKARAMMAASIRKPPKFSLSDFPEAWRKLADFAWDKTLILWGLPGIGKTSFAKVLLPNAYLVSHLDMLHNYDPGIHDGIIFDDMDFKQRPVEGQIALLDIDDDRAIHTRFLAPIIPAGTKKIMTTNAENGEIVDRSLGQISRRISVHHLIKSF